jgi:eukaryotic-like serine/threonine-protein kinase
MRFRVGSRFGAYAIRHLIGAGGMGEVYEAHDTRLGRAVALKVLSEHVAADPERLHRFTREAQVLGSLSHPNIATLYGFEQHEGVQALVLELAEGSTLADRLTRGALPPDEALAVARQIAHALEAAHARGIIHRDLKPSNIALRPDGTVKVLDFGLSRALDPARTGQPIGDATISSISGRVLGTPAYVSPEVVAGADADTRADIWAFGCVLYEMLTGRRAFAGDDTPQILVAVAGSEPDWSRLPRELAPAVYVSLRACLRKDPRQRLRDIRDVGLMLDEAAAIGVRSDVVRAPRRGHARRAVAYAVGSLLLGAGTAAAVWALAPRTSAPTVTFDIHAPEGSEFERRTMAPFPSVSPDGRQLAYAAVFGTVPIVWIQRIGGGDARPLAESAGAAFPFWSPDGRFVAFVTPGRLRKLAVAGGQPLQDICACDARFGGVWSSDGTILFGGEDGLHRVSAGGGVPRRVTRLDESRGEFSHRYPWLLPDARRFLYLVRSTRAEHRGVYLGSLDDPGFKRRLVADESNAVYSVDSSGAGLLFFVRDQALVAQPFDPVRASLSGEPIVVTRPIVPGEGGRYAPFAINGETIAYRRWRPARNRLVWMDRRGGELSRLGDAEVDYDYVALSSDARHVAVALRDWQTGRRDVWLMDTRRPMRERLTVDAPDAGFPVWTPDDTGVLFASTRTGSWDVYSQRIGGSETDEPVAGLPRSASGRRPRDITRDGRYLLFSNDDELWAQPLQGAPRAFALVQASDGRVSPDGRWLAYTTPGTTDRELYVTTFPTPTERRRVSMHGGWTPHWRHDGKELYFISKDHTLTALSVGKGASFDAGRPTPLFRASFDPHSLAFGSSYAPAPDGQRFLVVEQGADDEPVLTVVMNWRRNRP